MVTVCSLKIKRANVKLHTYCYRNIYFLKGENLNTQIHSVIYDDYNSVTYICLDLWKVWSIVTLFIHNTLRLKYQQPRRKIHKHERFVFGTKT